MNAKEVILRVEATYSLTIDVGESICRGQSVSESPEATAPVAPVSGIVTRVRFDPESHEFLVAIRPTT
jgi:Na+-translocating ferredoxin:NAD+ oxidoreductase RnfC subunit